ncbi:potassium channel subfamily K member 5-like [Dunckerocampus dactyliophorus]|uniref:potassium channel subfamily K member 5-like n=1 Tax=Dunckerocampus dactyliophorus TaxID=161453 RepID=UPI00240619F3|nr:potassium channel subfamily K member 5-like [Dunckerocampus dactyliophorus]
MADKGPFLTSCIIFYLSIGAAIFQILEEPNWELARSKYLLQKEHVLKKYPCLRKEDLDEILQVVSEAAGQGVSITGGKHHHMWDWGNSVIFAATIVTTIGYGNVAPKTKGGRVFCILYGLCGIPLCLVWISTLGSFFGDRAKRLSQVLIRRDVPVKRVQLICTALFLLWGLFVHLVIPPLVFMSMEGWSYLEGLYFSFITLTTVGFGDYVAGVNPNIEYPRLYRVLAEIWIYMGLAWLSLFFSWNVNMVVEAHKVFKKRRIERKRKHSETDRPTMIDIFKFLEKEEDYSTVIKEIGMTAKKVKAVDVFNRSKSCSDILTTNIETLDHSPRHRVLLSISEVFMNSTGDKEKQGQPLLQENSMTTEATDCVRSDDTHNEVSDTSDSASDGIEFTVPASGSTEEETSHLSESGTRFTIFKVVEEDLFKDEKG